jgi:DNA-directed RNA polymerase specialized sigma24 family protein
MSNSDTLALLREALELLNDGPNFGLRRDRRVTSYALASRIDAHIAGLPAQDAEHPAVAVSGQQYGDDDRISIDEPEYHVSEGEDVIWVRAWLRIDRSALPDVSLAVGEAYRRALDALPTMARDVFLLVRVNELDYRVIASLLNITVTQVEQYLADALVRIAHALDNDAAGS